MTATSQPSQRQRKVDSFVRAANIGAVAMLAYPFIYLGMEPIFIGYREGDPLLVPALFFLLMVTLILAEAYSVFAMFFKRNTDEFTQAMWHAGTSWAFFAAIVWLLLGSWVEAIFISSDAADAYKAYEAAKAQGLDVGEFDPPTPDESFIDRFAVHVILIAFFAGCQLKRIRGGF